MAAAPAVLARARPDVAVQDMGTTPDATPITVSIILKLQNAEDLDEFIARSVDPDSERYHRFLSVEQFRQRYAPSKGQIRRVTRYLESQGITVNEVYADNLVIKATGTAAQFGQAFSTTMRDYADNDGRKFHRPDREPHVPELLQDIVLYVSGLNTQAAQFQPHNTKSLPLRSKFAGANPAVVLPSGGSTATGSPGNFTTGDVANLYGVTPLYARGVTGKGMTVGIATLANFLPSDAYTYWSKIGLNVKQDRITQVHVDGGGDLSATAGSGETALDVEQSGGLAPDAKVIVYDAPNTEAGFIDVFYKAISDNLVDTLSVSWGSPEIFNYAIPGISADTQRVLVAYHQAFAEAAAQGISTFAAAGDSGAYDTQRSLPAPSYSSVLTVDSPASDPYIVAAGGTTVPTSFSLRNYPISLPTERIWGWDYLTGFCAAIGLDPVGCGIYSVGGGGGVSVVWPQPAYQRGVPGIRRSEPNQVLTFTADPVGAPSAQTYLYTVPANVKGRNLPDISLNSDPQTGYIVYSTPDGGIQNFYGGTSFAAPQLNGIFSLIAQAKGSRLGLLQPQLYALKMRGARSQGTGLNDIAAGDNWFYSGVSGYEPGAGLGTINAAALVRAIP
ncbi:MAG: S53 family peptidase [Pseudomonadota bacterium]|nr:S53 family peptidase [Pseudomonadota bacterium]